MWKVERCGFFCEDLFCRRVTELRSGYVHVYSRDQAEYVRFGFGFSFGFDLIPVFLFICHFFHSLITVRFILESWFSTVQHSVEGDLE